MTLNINNVWNVPTTAERRILLDDLVDAVVIDPDRFVVDISGAPRCSSRSLK